MSDGAFGRFFPPFTSLTVRGQSFSFTSFPSKVKIKEDLSGLLKLVGDAVQATGSAYREEFLDSLSNAFRGVIVDLYETDELGTLSRSPIHTGLSLNVH